MANITATDEKILIGIYVGSSSASAAFRLSSHPTVTPVIWSKGRTTIPLFITSQGDGDEVNLKFGYDADPFNSNKGFALRIWLEGKCFWEDHPPVDIITEELYRRRGKYYYCPINWNGPEDKRCFELFLGYMKTHIEQVLSKTYPGTANTLLQRDYCFVVPPFVPDWSEGSCVSIISEIFDTATDKCSFMPQPHASLLTIDRKVTESLQDADLLITCHIEEEVTSITHFEIESNTTTVSLKYLGHKTCVVGSDDIGDYFQSYTMMELIPSWAQTHQNMASAANLSLELAKMRGKYIENLNDYHADDDQRIRQVPRFLGARFTVPIQAQRIEIFNPVLDSIERHIPKLLSDYYPTSPKVLIMLSGPLAECPYAHTYLASCIEAQIRLIVSPGSPIAGISLLHTKDEATSPSLGATTPKDGWGNIYLDNAFEHRLVDTSLQIPHLLDVHNSEAISLHIAMRPIIWMLPSLHTSAAPQKLQVIAEMIITETALRQGVTSAAVHHMYYTLLKHLEDGSPLRAILSRLYTKQQNDILPETDTKRGLPALHLAAALNDRTMIESLVLGNSAGKDEKVASNLAVESFTPLEIRVWLFKRKDDKSVIGLLLGNDTRHAARLAARRGFKSLLKLFQKHSPQTFRRDCPTLIRLAILGQHTKTSEWLLESNPLFWSETQPTQIKDPCNQRLYNLSEIQVPRQFTRKLSYRDLRRGSSTNALRQVSEAADAVHMSVKGTEMETIVEQVDVPSCEKNRLQKRNAPNLTFKEASTAAVMGTAEKSFNASVKNFTYDHKTPAAPHAPEFPSQRKQSQPRPSPAASVYMQGGGFANLLPPEADETHRPPRNHLDNSDFSHSSLKRADAIICSLPEPGLQRSIDFGNWAMEYYYSNLQSKSNALESRSRIMNDAKQCVEDLKQSIHWQQPYLFCSHSSCAQEQRSDIEDDGKSYREFCYGPDPQLCTDLQLGIVGHSSVRKSPALKYGELCSSCKHHWKQHVYKRWHTVRESDLKTLEEVQNRVEMLELRIVKLKEFVSVLEKWVAEQGRGEPISPWFRGQGYSGRLPQI